MTRPELTPELILAAAQDAGNRHARANGRNIWTEDDARAANEKLTELTEIYNAQNRPRNP